MQWGAWGSVGMAAQNAAVLARIERLGMGVMKPAAGLDLLRTMLSASVQGPPQVLVSVLIGAFSGAPSWLRQGTHLPPWWPSCGPRNRNWPSQACCADRHHWHKPDVSTSHWQVLANPFAWPVLLGGAKAVPPVFAEVSQAIVAVAVGPAQLRTAMQATDAGQELGILYETAWQAVGLLEPHQPDSDEDEPLDEEHPGLVLARAQALAARPGRVRMAPRLLRSRTVIQPTDCALMPCPRGALGNLRFVPLHRQQPAAGEVQVML